MVNDPSSEEETKKVAKEEPNDPMEAFIKEYKELCQKYQLMFEFDIDDEVLYVLEVDERLADPNRFVDSRESTRKARYAEHERQVEEARRLSEERFKKEAEAAGIPEELLP